MSLNVSAALPEKAPAGEVSDEQFIGCVRESVPYAWAIVSQVAAPRSAKAMRTSPTMRSRRRARPNGPTQPDEPDVVPLLPRILLFVIACGISHRNDNHCQRGWAVQHRVPHRGRRSLAAGRQTVRSRGLYIRDVLPA